MASGQEGQRQTSLSISSQRFHVPKPTVRYNLCTSDGKIEREIHNQITVAVPVCAGETGAWIADEAVGCDRKNKVTSTGSGNEVSSQSFWAWSL